MTTPPSAPVPVVGPFKVLLQGVHQPLLVQPLSQILEVADLTIAVQVPVPRADFAPAAKEKGGNNHTIPGNQKMAAGPGT